MAFPGLPRAYPTKDETADYLEAYARAFELPVRTGVRVDRLAKSGDRFEVKQRLYNDLRGMPLFDNYDIWIRTSGRPERQRY